MALSSYCANSSQRAVLPAKFSANAVPNHDLDQIAGFSAVSPIEILVEWKVNFQHEAKLDELFPYLASH
ncbi:MAG: hypothetical protein KDJ90_23295 [Nitratireductor sp.]|nr:hypothetical protein [Nitratireductor sp.]